MSVASKAGTDNLYSKTLAKKFFDSDTKQPDKPEQKTASNTDAPAVKLGTPKVSVLTPRLNPTSPSTEHMKTAHDDDINGPSAETAEDQDSARNKEDDEDAWETEEEDKPKVVTKRRRGRRGRFASGYDSNEFDYVPDLYMGDPRDREVAEILYGPGAGYNPIYFSDPF